ncbi:MAG: HAD family phosphatase [Bacteroidetes bacterium]|nr:HAD family phosphatase [Bacteroidota bacterium]MCL5738680.1 HAD family phosphatase [Bacteroidota bacterium]
MEKRQVPLALFLDIGGVLLTNGWDHNSRKEAANKFGLDYEEMNERHHLTYDTFESGKLSLDEYLDRVVFYDERRFSHEDFKAFMYDQSQPFPEMLELIRNLKAKYNLKVGVVSNEGRELTEYRIKKFGLGKFVDFFISSCFVHFRKPDADIYRIALDVAQVSPDKSVYIDDRAMFVNMAQGLGINSIRHTSYQATRSALDSFGLSM